MEGWSTIPFITSGPLPASWVEVIGYVSIWAAVGIPGGYILAKAIIWARP
jgi:hypothetical protein